MDRYLWSFNVLSVLYLLLGNQTCQIKLKYRLFHFFLQKWVSLGTSPRSLEPMLFLDSIWRCRFCPPSSSFRVSG